MAKEGTSVVETEDPEGQPEETNDVEARLSKLEKLLTETTKVLDEERRASSGKDKKITELALEKKRLEQGSLSKDKLLEIREKEIEEKAAEVEAKNATKLAELEALRIELDRRKVLDKLPNFPSFLADRVRGNTPEEIEADAREIMKLWVKERDKVDNANKVVSRPKTGGGKPQVSVTTEDVKHMTPQEKAAWASKASEEEFNAIFDELHSG